MGYGYTGKENKMGTDLVLTYNDKEVADLGRFHKYMDYATGELELGENELYIQVDEIMTKYGKNFASAAAYCPKDSDDMWEVSNQVDGDLDELKTELLNYGMKIMLAIILCKDGNELGYKKSL